MDRGVSKRVAGGLAVLAFAVSAFGGGSVEFAGGSGGVGVPGGGEVGVGVVVVLVLGAVVASVLAVVVVVRVVLPAVFAGGGVVARGWRRVTPESPYVQGVLALGVVVGALGVVYLGMTAVLVQDVAENDVTADALADLEHHRSLVKNDTGEVLVHREDVGVVTNPSGVDDAGEDDGGGEQDPSDSENGDGADASWADPSPDADGDGLADAWERNGTTPWGAPLPDADPRHKDLYVQLNNGTNVDALNASERAQLVAAFERMSVDNPDGETGITLHVVDGGSVGEPVRFERGDSVAAWYTREHLGTRHCGHHQVVYGVVESENTLGWGGAPGYTSVVDARPFGRQREVPQRVQTTVHELLHNVVGDLGDGQLHTRSGWLASGSAQSLSDTTAAHLNATGFDKSGYDHVEHCGHDPGNVSSVATAA